MEIQEALTQCEADAAGNRSQNTADTYRYGLLQFTRFLDKVKVDLKAPAETLTIQHFIDYYAELNSKGYSKGTVRVYIAATRYFSDWLVERGILELSYNQGLRYQKATRNAMKKRGKALPRTPKRGDDEKMRDVVRSVEPETPRAERDVALVEFLYSTGCRINEVVQLRVRDVDMDERSVVVTGKGSKQRRVFFSTTAKDALIDYWAARGSRNHNDPVFARHDRGAGKKRVKGLSAAGCRHVIKEIAVQAGIEKHAFTPHSFRHAFAIRVLRETNNLALVQDLMGHANPSSTRVYAEIYPDELRDAHREIFK